MKCLNNWDILSFLLDIIDTCDTIMADTHSIPTTSCAHHVHFAKLIVILEFELEDEAYDPSYADSLRQKRDKQNRQKRSRFTVKRIRKLAPARRHNQPRFKNYDIDCDIIFSN